MTDEDPQTITPEQAKIEHEKWVRKMAPHELGDDHYWGDWPFNHEHDPPTHDIAWVHRCTNHGNMGPTLVLARIDVSSGNYHTLVSREPLHIEASILCVACKDHGFIRDSRWVKA